MMEPAQVLPRFAGAVLHELIRSQSVAVRPQRFDDAQLALADTLVGVVAPGAPRAAQGGDWLKGAKTIWSAQAIEALVGAIPKSAAIEAVNVDDESLKAVVERVAAIFSKASPADHQRAKERFDKSGAASAGELAYFQGLQGA
jgi:hypothetical protein